MMRSLFSLKRNPFPKKPNQNARKNTKTKEAPAWIYVNVNGFSVFRPEEGLNKGSGSEVKGKNGLFWKRGG